MVDALASGASVRMDVEVQVLSWAPYEYRRYNCFSCKILVVKRMMRPGGGIGRRASFRC